MPNNALGEKIRAMRLAAGLTQEQLAEKLPGVSGYTISRWERGETALTVEDIEALREVFGVSLEDMLNTTLPHKETEEEQFQRIRAMVNGPDISRIIDPRPLSKQNVHSYISSGLITAFLARLWFNILPILFWYFLRLTLLFFTGAILSVIFRKKVDRYWIKELAKGRNPGPVSLPMVLIVSFMLFLLADFVLSQPRI